VAEVALLGARSEFRSRFYRRSQRSQRRLRVLSTFVVNQIRDHSRATLPFPLFVSFVCFVVKNRSGFYTEATEVELERTETEPIQSPRRNRRGYTYDLAPIRVLRGIPSVPAFVFFVCFVGQKIHFQGSEFRVPDCRFRRPSLRASSRSWRLNSPSDFRVFVVNNPQSAPIRVIGGQISSSVSSAASC
jgi:hypothetical protein